MMRSSDVNRYVLRGGQVDSDAQHVHSPKTDTAVVPFSFEPVDSEGKATSEATKAEPAAVEDRGRIAALEAQLVSVRDEGYARGKNESDSALRATQSGLQERMDGFVHYLQKGLEAHEVDMATQAVKLAFAIAEKIIKRSLQTTPEALRETLLEALKLTDGGDVVRVEAHPETARSLKSQLDELAAMVEATHIRVEEDRHLAPGDLMIYRGTSTVDARLSTRLERVQRAVLRELGLDLDAPTDDAQEAAA